MISIETNKDSGLLVSRLEWPPKKDDLRRLYIEERLSAAKIALAYGLKTPNPRSAATLVEYHLKKNGIERRNRAEELQRQTKSTVDEWSARYPHVESTTPSPAEERAVVELLRAPNLSIKHMEKPAKRRVDAVLRHLYHERGLSQADIAKLIGNKTSGYVSDLFRQLGVQARDFEQARLEAVSEKLRKYERKSFDGTDEDKAYMLGLRHGDLSASVPFGDATRVSTSTTHPALSNLFTQLFSPYGHVYIHPRYKKDSGTYEGNLQAILDKSFEFLIESRDKCREWVLRKESTMLAYLAGLIDAEGHIRIYANPRTVGIIVSIWNTDTELLGFANKCLKKLGYRPMRPYLDKRKGGKSSGFHIERKKDYWRLQLGRFDEAQSLLRRLPLRHREKVQTKELALSVAKGEPYEHIRAMVASLKKLFDEQTAQFTKQAELEFLARHPQNNRGESPRVEIQPSSSGPVLCMAATQALFRCSVESYGRRLATLKGYLAVHDESLCLDQQPCVVLFKRSNARNIVRLLVHESIHHVLLWLQMNDSPDGFVPADDRFDRIVQNMRERGFRI
ncbi:MAG: LAGLIDADG family homing endonuclease [Thaumarchaeota archaeon]|nr:LAGLIDADG family homing endonuclease [Nitrososphaerota archaeon]